MAWFTRKPKEAKPADKSVLVRQAVALVSAPAAPRSVQRADDPAAATAPATQLPRLYRLLRRRARGHAAAVAGHPLLSLSLAASGRMLAAKAAPPLRAPHNRASRMHPRLPVCLARRC